MLQLVAEVRCFQLSELSAKVAITRSAFVKNIYSVTASTTGLVLFGRPGLDLGARSSSQSSPLGRRRQKESNMKQLEVVLILAGVVGVACDQSRAAEPSAREAAAAATQPNRGGATTSATALPPAAPDRYGEGRRASAHGGCVTRRRRRCGAAGSCKRVDIQSRRTLAGQESGPPRQDQLRGYRRYLLIGVRERHGGRGEGLMLWQEKPSLAP